MDTNILSSSAPPQHADTASVVTWMDQNSAALYLSVITIAEIEDGIAKCRRVGAQKKAERLSEWLHTVLHLYIARVVPIDLAVSRRIGVLSDLARGQGHAPGLADLAIAGTAQEFGYVILTRNLRHFRPLGVSAVDPYERLPSIGA